MIIMILLLLLPKKSDLRYSVLIELLSTMIYMEWTRRATVPPRRSCQTPPPRRNLISKGSTCFLDVPLFPASARPTNNALLSLLNRPLLFSSFRTSSSLMREATPSTSLSFCAHFSYNWPLTIKITNGYDNKE